jgi:hypothetical protein
MNTFDWSDRLKLHKSTGFLSAPGIKTSDLAQLQNTPRTPFQISVLSITWIDLAILKRHSRKFVEDGCKGNIIKLLIILSIRTFKYRDWNAYQFFSGLSS